MLKRLNYYQLNPRAIDGLRSIYHYVTRIDKKLRAVIELRVSQINQCPYCVDLHASQARAEGESQQRLDSLIAWHESEFFTPRERAALAWAESLTNISETRAPDAVYNDLQEHFSAEEIVDLTLIISMMNSWTRLAVAMRHLPDRR